jgi:hypothetical protein
MQLPEGPLFASRPNRLSGGLSSFVLALSSQADDHIPFRD